MKKDTNFIIIDMDDVSVIIVISFDLYKGYFVLYPISTQRSSNNNKQQLYKGKKSKTSNKQ